jgi:hypothetical protein
MTKNSLLIAVCHERPAMQKLIGFLAVIVIGLGLSGCSTVSPYSIRVNGYTNPGAPAPIKPGGFFCVIENKEAKNFLLEAEVKGKITKLLETRGYPVTTFDQADYYLLFAYGMGEPRRAGVAAPEYFGSIGWGVGYGWGGPAFAIGVPYGTYGADTAALYDRWLLIKVVAGPAYRARQDAPPVWVGEARSVGASSDLRMVLNYLLVADFKEFGKNTGKAVAIEIEAQNPEVVGLIR